MHVHMVHMVHVLLTGRAALLGVLQTLFALGQAVNESHFVWKCSSSIQADKIYLRGNNNTDWQRPHGPLTSPDMLGMSALPDRGTVHAIYVTCMA